MSSESRLASSRSRDCATPSTAASRITPSSPCDRPVAHVLEPAPVGPARRAPAPYAALGAGVRFADRRGHELRLDLDAAAPLPLTTRAPFRSARLEGAATTLGEDVGPSGLGRSARGSGRRSRARAPTWEEGQTLLEREPQATCPTGRPISCDRSTLCGRSSSVHLVHHRGIGQPPPLLRPEVVPGEVRRDQQEVGRRAGPAVAQERLLREVVGILRPVTRREYRYISAWWSDISASNVRSPITRSRAAVAAKPAMRLAPDKSLVYPI